MNRLIETHKVNGLNDELRIAVLDQPGQGNACHKYEIACAGDVECYIEFQNGPIAEVGVNGISNESLLAVVRDRLEGFQSGPYKCDTNEQALVAVIAAMESLHSRTKDRVDRGVEGTHAV